MANVRLTDKVAKVIMLLLEYAFHIYITQLQQFAELSQRDSCNR